MTDRASCEKEPPMRTGGLRVITERLLQGLPLQGNVGLHASRQSSVFVRSDQVYLARMVVFDLRSPLLALFTPNSGESLSKISIDTLGIAKGTIED